jgi:pimeloyl-ACP methyl ester carboxylesterase
VDHYDPAVRTEPSWTTASADGSCIAAYELGGAGETLLVAHATGFCGAMYQQFADELTHRFRVVAFDFRGHGASTATAGIDLGWDRMAEDLIAVANRIGDGPMHGFGHSMGGSTLLLAEAAQPGSFRSLFLYEPIVFPDDLSSQAQNVMSQAARRRRPHFSSRAEALYRFAGRPPFAQMRSGFVTSYIDNGFADDADGDGITLCCLPEHEAQTFEAGRIVSFEQVKGVCTPTVVAIGRDSAGPARLGRALAEGLTAGQLIRYAGLDHLGPFQDPWTIARDFEVHASA